MPRKALKRRPWIAATLSVLWPGLGHLYNGQPVSGAIAFLVVAAILVLAAIIGVATFWGFVTLLLIGLATILGVTVHAAHRARQLGVIETRWYSRWYALALILVVANLALPEVWSAAVLPFVRYRAYKLPTSSMEPTLLIGERFIVDTWRYRHTPPQRGDIAVFRYPPSPDRDMVKRCVATPGDTIQIVSKDLLVNGVRSSEPYAKHTDPRTFPADAPLAGVRARDHLGPQQLPAGAYFFLGDNRDNSFDSRFWGSVDASDVKAKALYVYWSSDLTRIGLRLE